MTFEEVADSAGPSSGQAGPLWRIDSSGGEQERRRKRPAPVFACRPRQQLGSYLGLSKEGLPSITTAAWTYCQRNPYQRADVQYGRVSSNEKSRFVSSYINARTRGSAGSPAKSGCQQLHDACRADGFFNRGRFDPARSR